jgi:hypothetical protein
MDQPSAPSATSVGRAATDEDRRNRSQFLLAMYKAMWDNINRHILVVWQSFAALFAALGASYLSGKQLLSPDLGTSIIVLAAGWSIAHAIDSAGWYNRNLLIITNIEQQFLFDSDAREVHHFFEAHRGTRPIEHLIIQMLLALTIAGLALLDHFSTRVSPGFGSSWSHFEAWRAVPYIVALAVGLALRWFHCGVVRKYKDLLSKSPGRIPQPSTADIVELSQPDAL